MASNRNQWCSTSSTPLPQNSGNRLRDPSCLFSIEGFKNSTKISPEFHGCDTTKKLSTQIRVRNNKICRRVFYRIYYTFRWSWGNGWFGDGFSTSRMNPLIWEVSFIFIVVFISWWNKISYGATNYDSPATSSGVLTEYSSSLVAYILTLSSISLEIPFSCLFLL